ncbi:gluconate 2-dehydrogenase subunit 3 family protein [Sphingobium sp. Leaf26]|uniref:gluconate 2-dehydrogenase subunit 3 family protein n=1 Tax=Sphingobium sp. Leaf26 TaxID=1735693 RepID=UPI000AD57542|nr:gluconate 2-dehydrogenase subunit 3 family protein [Sphingobium sp. Leaf26]
MAQHSEQALGERGLDRRQLIGAGLLLALGVGTPIALWRRHAEGESGSADAGQRALAERLSDLVVPATDTPGALAARVPDWLLLALSHGQAGTGTQPAGPFATVRAVGAAAPMGLGWLDAVGRQLNAMARGDFVSLPAKAQHDLLAALDAEAFKPGNDAHPWHKIKELILTGYYTSEIGGSQELRYELVPGRWEPDIPIGPQTRAFSSDWTAVDFG